MPASNVNFSSEAERIAVAVRLVKTLKAKGRIGSASAVLSVLTAAMPKLNDETAGLIVAQVLSD